MLSELQRIIGRVPEIDNVSDLDQFLVYGNNMEKSYDDMLLVGSGHVQANLPRVIFNMPSEVETMLEVKIDEGGTQDEQDKAERQAAEQVVSQFASSWRSRDAEAMQTHLTSGAKATDTAKIAGLMEDSSDISSFGITKTNLEDLTATIDGNLKKTTPDDTTITETWQFVVLKTNDVWLIDSWNQQ